jgi:membrane-associated HD superfamily phosphohydrolase
MFMEVVAHDKNRMAFLNLPDQTPMLPWAMQAPAMLRQTIYAPRWNEISPEQQLTDIQRGRVASAEQMSFLPDSQQASSLFALDANAMAAQNKVRSETERYNQMARERTEAAEADQKTRQSAADVVAAQTYQQQLGNELESNEADWRSWANRVQSNQMNNYLTVQEMNRANQFSPNVQFNGQGYEVINTPTYSVDSAKIPMTQEPAKKKKSTKRFGK